MNALLAKADTNSTETVIEMVRALVTDFQDGADAVLAALLSILEARLPEAEFLGLCAELEEAL